MMPIIRPLPQMNMTEEEFYALGCSPLHFLQKLAGGALVGLPVLFGRMSAEKSGNGPDERCVETWGARGVTKE